MIPKTLDCVIIGGGPAGLTAAIYLARFRLRLLVIDDGNSRAVLIPMTRNHAGFPDGISGPDLLARMARQAEIYGAKIERDHVDWMECSPDGFRVGTPHAKFVARTILLATGVVNRRPPIADELHGQALMRGLLRYCPICDGYEVTDKFIAVLGTGTRGIKEAVFLRSYSARVTLIAPDGDHELTRLQLRQLKEAGILVVDGPAMSFGIGEDLISLSTAAGRLSFDTLYPALGSDIRSELAVALGAKMSQDGCLVVGLHQETSVPGLFAAGDVVLGLDQISHAMGEGGVAATAIRNHLGEAQPLYR